MPPTTGATEIVESGEGGSTEAPGRTNWLGEVNFSGDEVNFGGDGPVRVLSPTYDYPTRP